MSIHSVNNSLASIHSGLLSEKKNDAKGTDDANQVDSSQAKRFGDESSTALDRIKNLPEIRSDVVAAARERLVDKGGDSQWQMLLTHPEHEVQ